MSKYIWKKLMQRDSESGTTAKRAWVLFIYLHYEAVILILIGVALQLSVCILFMETDDNYESPSDLEEEMME